MSISAFHSRCDAASSDWLRDRRVSWLWPSAFVLAGVGWLLVPGATGPVLAAAGFAIAGSLCVANALQCRRVHCAVTGPLYLVAALMFVAKAGGGSIPGGWIVAGGGGGTAGRPLPRGGCAIPHPSPPPPTPRVAGRPRAPLHSRRAG